MMSDEIKNNENPVLEPGDSELQRLRLSFAVVKAHFVAEFGGLVVAPVDLKTTKRLKILDQACADGLWLEDVCRTVRASGGGDHSYTGTDIVASYFPHKKTDELLNFDFFVQSMTASWPESSQSSFDLVHSRFSIAGAGTYPLHKVVAAEAALLKPGGWLQLEEMDMAETMKLPGTGLQGGNGPAGQETWRMLSEIFKMLGPGDDFGSKLKGWMKDAGLVDVSERMVVVRYGCNATVGVPDGVARMLKSLSVEDIQEMGTDAMEITVKGLVAGLKNLPDSAAKLLPGDLHTLPTRIGKECRDTGSSFCVRVVYGRKP